MHTLPSSRNNLDERGNFARCRTINPPVKKTCQKNMAKKQLLWNACDELLLESQVKTEDKLTYRQKKGWGLGAPQDLVESDLLAYSLEKYFNVGKFPQKVTDSFTRL